MAAPGANARPTLWQVNAPPAPETRSFEGRESVEFAVIGGGFTGLSAALTLARQKRSVLLLEANDFGSGATGLNTGWWGPTWAMVKPSDIAKKYGADVRDRLMRLVVEATRYIPELIRDYRIECGHSDKGLLLAASSLKTLYRITAEAAEWQYAGADASQLNAEQLRKYLATDYYKGAIHYHNGGTLNPLALAHGIARAAIQEGAVLHSKSRVQSLSHDGSAWRIETPAGDVTAKQVILATGGSRLTPIGKLRDTVYRLRMSIVASSPFPDHGASITLAGIPFADMDSGDTFGGGFDPDGRLIMSILPGFNLDVSPNEIAAPYWAKFRKVFPQAPDNITWDYGWYGEEAVPGNRFASYYKPAEGLHVLQGYAGNGVGQSIIYGRELALHLASDGRLAAPLPQIDLKPVAASGLFSGLINRVLVPTARQFLYR